MRRLTTEDFLGQTERFDEAVRRSGDIDHFCSSSDWIVPASAALMPPRQSHLFEWDGHYWAFMTRQAPSGDSILEPLEAMWGAACPVVGPDVEVLTEGIRHLCAARFADWRLMLLTGLPEEHPLLSQLLLLHGDCVNIGLGEASVRMVASLDGGMSAYLGRRSKNFRRSLRRSQAKSREAGIVVEDASECAASALYERIIDVERRGWKGRDDVGIVSGDMNLFYQIAERQLHLPSDDNYTSPFLERPRAQA